jgi:hypothetical protein
LVVPKGKLLTLQASLEHCLHGKGGIKGHCASRLERGGYVMHLQSHLWNSKQRAADQHQRTRVSATRADCLSRPVCSEQPSFWSCYSFRCFCSWNVSSRNGARIRWAPDPSRVGKLA